MVGMGRVPFRVTWVALSVAGWSCSGSETPIASGSPGNGNPDASAPSTADILTLIRRNNDLSRQNYPLYCAHCACGAFLDVTPAVEECVANVIGEYPTLVDAIVDGLNCSIAKGERRQTCLRAATDCTAANACNDKPDARAECDRAETLPGAMALMAEEQRRCN